MWLWPQPARISVMLPTPWLSTSLLPPARATTARATPANVPLPRLEDSAAPPFATGVTWTLLLPLDVLLTNSVPFGQATCVGRRGDRDDVDRLLEGAVTQGAREALP